MHIGNIKARIMERPKTIDIRFPIIQIIIVRLQIIIGIQKFLLIVFCYALFFLFSKNINKPFANVFSCCGSVYNCSNAIDSTEPRLMQADIFGGGHTDIYSIFIHKGISGKHGKSLFSNSSRFSY